MRSAACAATIKIKKAQAEIAKIAAGLYNYFETGAAGDAVGYRAPRAFYSTLFKYARCSLRAGDERAKTKRRTYSPNFATAARESLELELFSTEPVYDDVENLRLTDSLTDFAAQFGAERSAGEEGAGRQIAARSRGRIGQRNEIERCRRPQRTLRRRRAPRLQAAHDPMIDLARLVDGPAREARKIYEAQDESKQQAYAEIAKARFAIEGTSTYPDATFTLRLSYGTGARLRTGRKTNSRVHQFRRLIPTRRRAQQQAAVRPAETLDRQQGEA